MGITLDEDVIQEQIKSNYKVIGIEDNGDSKSITIEVDNTDLVKEYLKPKAIGTGFSTQRATGAGMSQVMNRFDPYNPTRLQYMNWTSRNVPYSQAIQLPTEPHDQMKLAMMLYQNDPIVGTVIDLMVDFACSGFENECEDPNTKKFYDDWCKEVNMDQLLEWIFLEYFRTGNVTIYKSMNDVEVVTNKGRKSSKMSGKKYPTGYTVLNPLIVWIEGSLLFNQDIVAIKVNEDLKKMVNSTDPGMKSITSMFPPELISGIQNGEMTVPLDPDLVTRITRRKQPYERYATPMLHKTFEACLYKQNLRMMDISTIEGLVNQLITVTIGDKDYPATDYQLQKLAALFQTPNKAYTIFWNHTLNVTFHKPEGIETLTADKYKEVNDDILMGLGITRVLLDGQGSNFSTAWVSILSLMQRLEMARNLVKNWLEKEYKQIAEDNNFPACPTIRFDKLSLRDDAYMKNVILSLYDRGLLSGETVLTESGYQIDVEAARKEVQEKEYKDIFVPPNLPFSGDVPPPPDAPKTPGPTNQGRPNNPGDNNYTKREIKSDPGGNPPKKKSSAGVAFDDLSSYVEPFSSNLNDTYYQTRSSIENIYKDKKKTSAEKKSAMIAGMMAYASEVAEVGNNSINDVYDYVYNDISNAPNNAIYASKLDYLHKWHNDHAHKLAADVATDLNSIEEPGEVDKVFASHLYRVHMMGREVPNMAYWHGQLAGHKSMGKKSVIWRAEMAKSTCAVCAERNGKKYSIDDIPDDHPNGHCRLEFSE